MVHTVPAVVSLHGRCGRRAAVSGENKASETASDWVQELCGIWGLPKLHRDLSIAVYDAVWSGHVCVAEAWREEARRARVKLVAAGMVVPCTY